MLEDLDPAETREWLEALDSVLAYEGADRAFFLLDEVVTEARRKGAAVPYSATTPYLNTIPPDSQDRLSPRQLAIDHRIRSLIRWNALAIVLRANAESSELGGHIASFQSAATLYDVGFQHFFRGASDAARRRPAVHPGTFVAGHLRPLVRGRPADRGSADEVPDGNRRRWPFLLPAPVADAGLLADAHGVDGPGPDHGDLPGALPEVPGLLAGWPTPRAGRSGRSSATGRPTSRSRWAPSRWPAARSSTTSSS